MNGSRRANQDGGRGVLTNPWLWLRVLPGVALLIAFISFHPVERVLHQDHDLSNPLTWKDALAWLVIMVLIKETWMRLFRRQQLQDEKQKLRTDLLAGHLQRMSFTARTIGTFVSLLLVLLGEWSWYHNARASIPFLSISGVLFLFFVLQEVSILLVPGNSLLPNRNDELLSFFSARVLRIGFAFAIAGLTVMSLLALFRPSVLAPILPIWLALSVFLPALRLNRYEHEADVGG